MASAFACGAETPAEMPGETAPAAPEFSVSSTAFVGVLQLELRTKTESGRIVYTVDGTLPTQDHGTTYEGAITIESTAQIIAATIASDAVSNLRSESFVLVSPEFQNYRSTLPICVLDNLGGGDIPDKGWTVQTQTGAGLIQPARQDGILHLIESGSLSAGYSTRMGIRVRGAFSSTWTHQPYSIETWFDAGGEDRAIGLLGMSSDSDWVLYYLDSDHDRTLLYNTFIWALSGNTGRYSPAFRFVDVFLNKDGSALNMSHRVGVYALVEKVKRGTSRIPFEKLSMNGTTGGWLLGINRMDPEPPGGFPTENGAVSPQFFHTMGPDRVAQTESNSAGGGDDIPRQYNAHINFEHPNGYKINSTQRNEIEQWFVGFEDVLYDDSIWLDPIQGYRRYLNTQDFIDYFHLLNLAKQGDGLLLSMFPWVSSGERKLHMGPLWDFNNGAYAGSPEGPLLFRADRLWYPRLFEDPSFRKEFFDRWHELRKGPLATDQMHAIIDAQAAEVRGYVEAQGLPENVWDARLASMKAYLAARAAWLDENHMP